MSNDRLLYFCFFYNLIHQALTHDQKESVRHHQYVSTRRCFILFGLISANLAKKRNISNRIKQFLIVFISTLNFFDFVLFVFLLLGKVYVMNEVLKMKLAFLPNTLSVLRFIVAIWIFFLIDNSVLFLILYLLCGLSDVLDGYIARKLGIESKLGAQLDTLGDVALYSLIVFVIFIKIDAFQNTFILILLSIILVSKLINLLVTRAKFRQWNIIHTLAYKIIGCILFFIIPCFYLLPAYSSIIVVALCVISELAAIEEFIILIFSKKYNVNRKSLFLPE